MRVEFGDERSNRGAECVDAAAIVLQCLAQPGGFRRWRKAFDQGGYEAGVAPFAPEADGMLVKGAIAVLEEVR